MDRYPIYIQDEENACGAYCIQSLLAYYHQKEEVSHIKEKCGLDVLGITIYGMLQALKDYHIEAKAFKGELEDLLKMNTYPCILHTLTSDNHSHYVILYAKKKDKFIVGDPSMGLLKLSEGELYYRYSGLCIVIDQVGKKEELSYQSLTQFILDSFKKYPSLWLKNGGYALMIFLLNFLFSLYYKWMIEVSLNSSFSYLSYLFLCFMCVALVKMIVSKIYQLFHLNLEKIFIQDYTLPSFNQLLKKEASYFHQQSKSEILVKLQSMYTFPSELIQYLSTFLLEGFMILSSLCVIFFYHQTLALLYSLFILGFILLTFYQHLFLEKITKYMMHFLSSLQQSFLDVLNSFQDIHQYRLVSKLQQQIHRKYQDYYQHYHDYQRKLIDYQNHSQFIFELFLLFVFYFGALYVNKEKLGIDQLVFIYILLSYSLSSILSLSSTLKESHSLKLSFERYKDLIHSSSSLKNEPLDTITSIVYDQVSFGYGYRLPILNHCSCIMHHHLMIKGKNGSGKSSLVSLLLHPEWNYQGKIFINGKDLKNYSRETLLEHIVYVSDETYLFEGTLKENLLLDSSNEQKLYDLLQKFDLKDLTQRLDQTVDSSTPFSLGQRQCIGLLRIMLHNYDVLILDESFSHIEDQLSRFMLKEILKLYQDKIVIMIFHQTKVLKSMFKGEIIDMDEINS